MQSTTSPKKPSPLSFGSPRNSPFRRPDSPGLALDRSPSSSTVRPAASLATPTSSPSRTPRAPATLQPPEQQPSPAASVKSVIFSPQNRGPTGGGPLSWGTGLGSSMPKANGSSSDPLSRLSATQVREIRESFQVLDRNNDGQVGREDVADMLNQLGLDSSQPAVSQYFSPSAASTVNLSTYLNTLSALLSDLSRPDELSAAFAAFDVDDSGQVDVAELRDALLHTPTDGGVNMSSRDVERVMEGFTGRRTFNKGAAGLDRGMVFRYKEFEAELQGGARREGEGIAT